MVSSLAVIGKFCLEYVWKKENFKDDENNKKLDSDYQPELFTYFHIFKAVDIKIKNLLKKFFHK